MACLRLSDVTLVGRLPEELLDHDPQLAESAGVIFLLDPDRVSRSISAA